MSRQGRTAKNISDKALLLVLLATDLQILVLGQSLVLASGTRTVLRSQRRVFPSPLSPSLRAPCCMQHARNFSQSYMQVGSIACAHVAVHIMQACMLPERTCSAIHRTAPFCQDVDGDHRGHRNDHSHTNGDVCNVFRCCTHRLNCHACPAPVPLHASRCPGLCQIRCPLPCAMWL